MSRLSFSERARRYVVPVLGVVTGIGISVSCQHKEEASRQAENQLSARSLPSQTVRVATMSSFTDDGSRLSSGRHAPLNSDEIEQQLLRQAALHPERSDEILCAGLYQLAEHDPERALIFAGKHLGHRQKVREVGAIIAARWLADDEHAVRLSLETLLAGEESDQTAAQTILDLVVEPQAQRFDLNKWLAWVDSLGNGDTSTVLQGELLEAVLNDVHPSLADDMTQVITAYVSRSGDDAFRPYFQNLARVLGRNQPEMGRSFLAEMPPGDVRDEFVGILFDEVGRTQPELAAEWLRDPEVLTELTGSDQGDGAWETKFDQLLTSYIENLAGQFPDDALDNLSSLIDPDMQEKLRFSIEERAQQTRREQEVSSNQVPDPVILPDEGL